MARWISGFFLTLALVVAGMRIDTDVAGNPGGDIVAPAVARLGAAVDRPTTSTHASVNGASTVPAPATEGSSDNRPTLKPNGGRREAANGLSTPGNPAIATTRDVDALVDFDVAVNAYPAPEAGDNGVHGAGPGSDGAPYTGPAPDAGYAIAQPPPPDDRRDAHKD